MCITKITIMFLKVDDNTYNDDTQQGNLENFNLIEKLSKVF